MDKDFDLNQKSFVKVANFHDNYDNSDNPYFTGFKLLMNFYDKTIGAKEMQTIKIELEDSLYENIVAKGIDIQSKIKEFIYETMDDGYPAISFEEAKQRVADAVERYKTGKGTYYTEEEYEKEMNAFFDLL